MTSFGGLIGGFEEPRRYGGMLGVMGRGPVMGDSLGSICILQLSLQFTLYNYKENTAKSMNSEINVNKSFSFPFIQYHEAP